jgi:predicted amidohydrolase
VIPPARKLRLGLLQYPVERPASIAAFGTKLDRWLAEAAPRADLLVLPEYAAVELGAGLVGRATLPTSRPSSPPWSPAPRTSWRRCRPRRAATALGCSPARCRCATATGWWRARR